MSVRVEHVPPDRAPPAGPFLAALRAGEGEAAGFLPGLPSDDEGWLVALAAARGRAPRVPSASVARIVARQQALGTGPRAERNAAALADADTLAVVTGQQPGLLGGLLLAYHKAAGAMRLAEHLDGLAEGRVVPVFWLASEDHDLDEANRALLLDRLGQPRRLALDLVPDGRSLMDLVPDAADVGRVLEEAALLLPDTARAHFALDHARAGAASDLGTWDAQTMARFLGDAGLVVLDPRDVLPDAGDALADLVVEAEAIGRALREAGARLKAAGLPAPLAPPDDYVPLFLRTEEGTRRRRLVRSGQGIALRGGERLGSVQEVADRVRARPALASGDVVGRVFVQDRLLPVLGYVGGPTELAYHAQVRKAHDAVGVPYPLALPRPEATWVDAKAERTAVAFGCLVADLLGQVPWPEAPAGSGDAALEAGLEAWREAIGGLPADLKAWSAAGGERRAALERAERRLDEAFDRATRDLRRAAERERGAGSARWARLGALLGPRGRPQERGLSAISLVARYGEDAFREGLAGIDPLAPGHHIVHVG